MSKSTKTIKLMIMSVCAAFALSCQAAEMYKETVSGITWTFTVENGCASVGGGFSYTAVPKSTSGNIAVPSSLGGCPVTRIEGYAFYNCRDIIAVTIPDSIKSIGYQAFYGCNTSLFDTTSITGVKLVDGWAVGNTETFVMVLDLNGVRGIADYAFNGCSGVSSVTIGENVLRIGDNAFRDCSSLASVTVQEGLLSFGTSSFHGCNSLTNVVIPHSVTDIGPSAFENCSGLLNVSIPSSVTSIGDRAFVGCSGLKNLVVPQVVLNSRFMYIFSSAYSSSITNVVVGDGVTCIGDNAFLGCRALRSVTIPDSVLNIEDTAFNGCDSLASVAIPDSVKSIGYGAFYNCSALTNITMPHGLTSLGERAFCGCSSLTGDLIIPEGISSIESMTFYNCRKLTSVTIPDSIMSIGSSAFDGCSDIRSVTISQYVCTNKLSSIFPSAYSAITNVVISSEVTRLVDYMFNYCNSVSNIVFKGNTPAIEGNAFYGISSGCVVYVTPSSTGWGVEIPGTWRGMRIEYMVDEVEMPVITPSDGATFRNASCTITIMCETPGASIYYTTDGGTPRPTSRYLYSGPFVIEDTTEICAMAVKDGKYSDYVTATITKGEVLTLPEALGVPTMAVMTGGDAEWSPVDDAVAIHGLSAMSGGIAPEEESWIEFSVLGAGTISFNWRSDCEKDPRNRYSYDRGIFSIDGTAICKIDGLTDWMAVTNVISSGGVHVIRWTYIKDDYDEDDYTGEDCILVNDVSWAPIELIPELLVDAAATTVTNAIETAGFADESGVKAAIGGSAAKYAAFKEWAGSVKGAGSASDAFAGEAAVVANANAAVAFLLGAKRLFENAPTIEMEGMTVVTSATLQGGGGQGSVRPTEVTVSVAVKDGENAVACDADKIKDMFEATTDLGDWNGTAKLKPTVTVVHGGNSAAEDGCSSMRFTVVPGDGTATRAFLRVKVK